MNEEKTTGVVELSRQAYALAVERGPFEKASIVRTRFST
jgi:hypothetical protein